MLPLSYIFSGMEENNPKGSQLQYPNKKELVSQSQPVTHIPCKLHAILISVNKQKSYL